jgi:dihydrolipoamide dehydrogenase
MSVIEIKVPDIGDFKEVEVIELLVKVGDQILKEQSLITVESDKASMEIPAAQAGTVKELRIKVGDKVAEGSVILTLEESVAQTTGETAKPAAPTSAPAGSAPASRAPVANMPVASATVQITSAASPRPVSAVSAPTMAADLECQVLVLGGGPGGYSAAFRAADLGLKTILIERYATLGGVCLNVGCIPSKALLHSAAVVDQALAMAGHGITFAAPKIDLDKLRTWKSGVVSKLTGGLAAMAKGRKVDIVRGIGQFAGPNHLQVELTEGSGQKKSGARKTIRFDQAIIAVGSQPIHLPFMPDDPRVVDSTSALALKSRPKKMLIVGGGIIGLEMGTVYSTLGASLDVAEMADGLMLGADRDLVRVWQKFNAHRFEKIMLKTRAVKMQAAKAGISVWFEGEQAPEKPLVYDLVLSAVGRTPNGGKINAEAAGVVVDARGFIGVDLQMRTSAANIFAIGDVIGQPMLAHKAVHEGHVAAEVAAGHKAFMDASVIPSVAYTDPEVAWVGMTEDEARQKGVTLGKGLFPWAASGRAIANGRDEGFTKLLFDEHSGRIVGGGMVGTHAGDMIGEIALAIEMGADAVDIGKTIHPHPTLGESIGMAAEVFEGVCTDLMPTRKK